MSEVTFPLLGTAFVVLVVLPLSALFTKGLLLLLERSPMVGTLHGLNLRYVLLTASSALPLAWFLSAGLHQAETGRSVLACLFAHEPAEFCFEPVFFALTLATVAVACMVPALRGASVRAAHTQEAAALLARVERLIAKHAVVAELRDRVRITDEPGFALGSHGAFKPRIVIGVNFGAQLSDDMLVSALGHEREHLRSFDPLRYLALKLALAMNPFGRRLLEPHAARWYAAREAQCDREAVLHGAQPLPLAEAILRAARPSAREAVALGAADTRVLRFRIGMLLAFAEHSPVRCCQHKASAFPIACLLIFLALLLPHHTGTEALDALHSGAEHALTHFWQ